MSSSGYGSFADPNNSNREVSSCTQQEANAKEFNLFTKASLLLVLKKKTNAHPGPYMQMK